MKKIIIGFFIFTFSIGLNASIKVEIPPSIPNYCYGILNVNDDFHGISFNCEHKVNEQTIEINKLSKVKSGACYSFSEKDLNTYYINQVSCPDSFTIKEDNTLFLTILEKRLTNLNCRSEGEWSVGCPASDKYGNDVVIVAGFP